MLIICICIIAATLILIWVLCRASSIQSRMEEQLDYCKGCRYRTRNCTQEPCITCANGSEYVKSELIDQEDFNE